MINLSIRFVRLAGVIAALGLLTAGTIRAATVVQFNLNGYSTGIFGDKINNYQIQLFDDNTSVTVANFLKYVNSDAYNESLIHRSVSDFVIQGGGFHLQTNSNNVATGITPIATYGTIKSEAGISNERGTIAMALPSYSNGTPAVNYATNQWFINLANNTGLNGNFTVFGQVAGEGMTLVDGVASLNKYDISGLYSQGALNEVPLADGKYLITVVSANVVTTVDWKGKSSTSPYDWGTAANWSPASGVPNAAGVNITLGSKSTANVIDLGSSDRKVGNIYFSPDTSTSITSTSSHSLIINNNGSTSLINVIGDHSISASMVLANDTLFSVDGTMAVSGAISGTGSLALNNKGTLTLTGSNSYTGQTLVTSGALIAGSAASLPGYNTPNKVVVSSGASLTVRAGAAGQWLSADFDALQANATFNSGSFLGIDTTSGDFAHGDNISGNMGLVKSGLNTLTLSGSNSYAGTTKIVAGAMVAVQAASLPGFDKANMINVSNGATLVARVGAASGEWSESQVNTLLAHAVFNSGSSLGMNTTSADFAFSGAISGNVGLTKLGQNTLILSGHNTFTGAVNVNGGYIKAANNSNLGAGSQLNFNGGGLIFDGVFDPSSNRTLTFNDAGAILHTNDNDIVIANSIGGGGNGGLTKSGNGVLTIAGAANYFGTTEITQGALYLGADGALPITTRVVLSGSYTEFNINGHNQTIAAIYGEEGSRLTLNDGGALTITEFFGEPFSGLIDGTSDAKLILENSASQYLSGEITFGGDISITDNCSLYIRNDLETTLNAITGTGNLNVEGTSILKLASLDPTIHRTVGPNAKLFVGDQDTPSNLITDSLMAVPEPGTSALLLSFAALVALYFTRIRK